MHGSGLKDRLHRGLAIGWLTRRYYRSAQVPGSCTYYLCGRPCRIEGPEALSLVLDNYWHDAYGLRRFRSLPTIVDIGANIGAFSLHAANRFNDSRIIAFEPYQAVLDHLRRNAAGYPIEIHAAAVTGESGLGYLKSSADSTASTLVRELAQSEGGYQQCALLAFDDVVGRISGPISFLKLDCEGSEYSILASAAIREVQNIAGELHTSHESGPDDALALLRRSGFIIEAWSPSPPGTEVLFRARNRKRVAPSTP